MFGHVVITLVVAGVGLIAASLALGRARTLDTLAPSVDGPSSTEATTAISIIVPARNEASSLPHLLASVASMEHRTIREVIVVDDGSTDETSAIARAGGAVVVSAPPPPDGWLGKSWACSLGAERATGTLLLFLDADVRLAPGAIDRVLRAADVGGGGLTSIQPHHRPRGAIEQLSAYCNAASVLGSGAFSTRPPGAAVAFGPCLLTSRADYDLIGGHAGVRAEIVEDIALARRYRAGGLPVSCWLGGRSVRFRMYPDGFRSLVQGWTKNIAAGAGSAEARSVIATSVWLAASVAVALALVEGVFGWVVDGVVPTAALVAWAVTACHTWYVLRRLGSFRTSTALLFPVPLAFFVFVFVRSFALHALRRPVRWRGRDLQPAGR